MARFGILAIAVLLLAVAAACADFLPPLPPDQRYVDPRVRFVGIENYPDQAFVLRYSNLRADMGGFPHRLVHVKDSSAFKLPAGRVEYMELVAVPRKEFETRSQDDPHLDQWLNGHTAGNLRARINPPSSTVPANGADPPINTYRVSFQDGQLAVEKVDGQGWPLGLLPTWALAIVASVSIAWLGIWLARRQGSRASRLR